MHHTEGVSARRGPFDNPIKGIPVQTTVVSEFSFPSSTAKLERRLGDAIACNEWEEEMASIEYGSYYWCVVLNGKDAHTPGESVHLHADTVAVDPTGTLLFKSAGRRQAGTEPTQPSDKEKKDDKKPGYEKDEKSDNNGEK